MTTPPVNRPPPVTPPSQPADGPQAATLRRAAFLDRDGVINIDTAYLHRWEDFQFVPGAVDAMRRLHLAGYALVVITNQSGIARGLYGEEDYQELTRQMTQRLGELGAPLSAVYHCPHHPGGSVSAYAVPCDCRKPQPGMILRAARDLQLCLAHSVLVGDKSSDIEAAQRAGVGRSFLVASAVSHVAPVLHCATGIDPPSGQVYANLADVVAALLVPDHSTRPVHSFATRTPSC